ncbi:hypothetical protein Goari_001232 [Gossypium aridum]|uniref:Uncharacterized protein n=1 Tax=Gossypium aridum TaxID=34290 RepID=A0A7J8YJ43_GOSAI|nr:hypothetical protein [Gossypium aridum]
MDVPVSLKQKEQLRARRRVNRSTKEKLDGMIRWMEETGEATSEDKGEKDEHNLLIDEDKYEAAFQLSPTWKKHNDFEISNDQKRKHPPVIHETITINQYSHSGHWYVQRRSKTLKVNYQQEIEIEDFSELLDDIEKTPDCNELSVEEPPHFLNIIVEISHHMPTEDVPPSKEHSNKCRELMRI